MLAHDELDRETVVGLLRTLKYWYERFEQSRDPEHLNHALRVAEALEDYLPRSLRGLNLIGLVNLYERLPCTQGFQK
jgi:hypothetical protein